MSIEVEGIGKRFGDFVALDDVNVSIPTGQLTALLGPSGGGKSTLLRIIAGLEYADTGRIEIEGVDATNTPPQGRNVGFVFQHYAAFKHLSVRRNVAFGLEIRKRPKAEIKARVDELLELVHLSQFGDRLPAQLSGGQRQRMALARALAVEPNVLLLDEPFGALDAKVRKELRRWLRKLHDELHVTSIFVTHDQEEALEVADRVVLMNQGEVEQIGTPEEVYRRPATPFVYGFLGAVNLFHGRVDGEGLRVGDARLPQQAGGFGEGTEVLAFARPHELDIVVDADASAGIAARVSRVLAFGITARVELDGVNGARGQHFEVEITRERIERLGLAEGQTVRLLPSHLSLFESRQAATTAGAAR